MTDIAEIRARHEAAQADGRYDLSWHEDHGLLAHTDRAVLLARVAELEGALKPFALDAAETGDGIPDDATYALADYIDLGVCYFMLGDLRRAAQTLKETP